MNHKDIEIINQAIKKYAELYHEKQLRISSVSKSFSFGVKAQITHCIKGHEFEIGEFVEIIDYHEDGLRLAKSLERSNQQWYINEEEANVC